VSVVKWARFFRTFGGLCGFLGGGILKPTLCIYHGNCADGFGAALAVWLKYGNDVKYHVGVYGQPIPDVNGQDVVLVDFSYKRAQMSELCAKNKSVLVLDHHKSAMEDLDGLENGNLNLMAREKYKLLFFHTHMILKYGLIYCPRPHICSEAREPQ